MSRYIDRDFLEQRIHETMDMQDLYLPIHFIQLMDELDDADVVEVVRCKDCPLSKTDPNDYEDVYWCDFTPGRAHHSMDYCSEGARQKQMR